MAGLEVLLHAFITWGDWSRWAVQGLRAHQGAAGNGIHITSSSMVKPLRLSTTPRSAGVVSPYCVWTHTAVRCRAISSMRA
jgi:hypothetical protein